MPKRLNKKASERTEKESAENKLCEKWRKTKEKETVDRYFGIKIEEIPEKDRELVKLIRNYGYLGKRQNELTPFEEIIKFAEENGRMPKRLNKKVSERTEKESEEDSLYHKWRKTKEKKILEEYAGQPLENVPEEDREKIAKLRIYGMGINPSKLRQAKQQRDDAKSKNDQAKELEKQVSEQLKKRGQAHEEQ